MLAASAAPGDLFQFAVLHTLLLHAGCTAVAIAAAVAVGVRGAA